MITTDDLVRIRKVIREEVTTEVKDSTRTLDHEIRMSRMQIQQNIDELDDRMKNVEIRTDIVSKDVKDIQKRVRRIEKNVDVIARLFDATIEDHLGLSSNN